MASDRADMQYQARVLKAQYQFARNKQYTDFKITVKNTIIHCHKSVICAESEFFRHICDGKSEATLEHSVVKGDGPILEAVVKFMYLGCTDVTQENVTKLLLAAHRLQHKALVQHCITFMTSTLEIGNFVSYAKVANEEGPDLSELRSACDLFSRESFHQVIETDWYRSLSLKEVKAYLQHDDLNVMREEDVLEAVRLWLHYYGDPNNEQYWRKLMPCIRLKYCDSTRLKEFSQNEALNANFRCRIMEYLNRNMHGNDAPRESYAAQHVHHRPASVRTRELPFATKKEIIIVGGAESDGKLNESLLYYDKDDSFLAKTSMLNGSMHYSVCGSEDLLIISGGFNRQSKNSVPTVKKYSLSKRSWRKCENLMEPRDSHGSAIVSNKLFVLGGKQEVRGEEPRPVMSVAVLDLTTRQWSEGKSMDLDHAVYAPGVAVVGNDILLVGGNQRLGIYVAKVLKYNTLARQWVRCQEIPRPCAPYRSTAVIEFAVFVLVEGELYEYSVLRNKWQKVNSETLKLKDCALISRENSDNSGLLAFGGKPLEPSSGAKPTDRVYMYDEARKTWSLQERRMPVPLRYHWVLSQ